MDHQTGLPDRQREGEGCSALLRRGGPPSPPPLVRAGNGKSGKSARQTTPKPSRYERLLFAMDDGDLPPSETREQRLARILSGALASKVSTAARYFDAAGEAHAQSVAERERGECGRIELVAKRPMVPPPAFDVPGATQKWRAN